MARAKKEQKKVSPEERMLDRWDQQVFFLRKQFPNSQNDIQKIKKAYEKKTAEGFLPCEEALMDLTNLYAALKGNAPSAPNERETTAA